LNPVRRAHPWAGRRSPGGLRCWYRCSPPSRRGRPARLIRESSAVPSSAPPPRSTVALLSGRWDPHRPD
jgi:hypothetical protein